MMLIIEEVYLIRKIQHKLILSNLHPKGALKMSMSNSEKEYFIKNRPHVVILGAGASCATIPNGDKNGRKIPAMKGFIEAFGLEKILEKVTINTTSDNLEDIYMELERRSANEPICAEVQSELNDAIRKGMNSYCLPDTPTIYDFLILSLRRKDLIATFNWDPFLVQAYKRVARYTNNLPNITFLHGNVAVGFCEQDKILGNAGEKCSYGHALKSMQLLYPVANKDYTSDAGIAASWRELNKALKIAYMITIFGYSAPKSDVQAIEMMKKAWGPVDNREYEQIEVINIGDEETVIKSWDAFIHTHHYDYCTSFFDSSLAKYPRRTCDTIFDNTLMCRWSDDSLGFKEGMSFENIQELISPLLEDEDSKAERRVMLCNPYVESM